MSRKLIGGLAAIAIVALVIGLVMRRGGDAKKADPVAKAATAPAKADPWAKAAGSGDAQEADARAPRGFAPKWSLDVDPEGPLRLEGQVVDQEGRPVGGAQIAITSVPKRTTTSEEDGSFAFDKLVGRTYVLSATSKDLAGELTYKLMAASDPAVIHMTEGVTVVVKVSDDEKQPVAGAEVTSGELSAKTDDKGSAQLKPLRAGWIGVEVKASGYALGNGLTTIGSPGGSGEITVTLHKGVALTGRVVDESGKPVGKVHVSIDTNDWIGNRGADSVETDAEGTFTFPAVPAGTHTVSAADGEHEPAESSPVTVANRPVSGVVVRMKAGGQISGTVVDKDGAPAPYATVRVASTGARMWRDPARQATTDAKGKFELHGLARGKLQARAESDAAASKIVDVDLTADVQKKDLRLVLDVSGRIEGIVVDETGQPVPEISVHAFPDVINGGEREGLALAGMSSAETDGAGKFTIHGLPDGPYRLWASRSGGGGDWGRQSVAAKTGDHAVKIVLPAPGTLVGKLTMENGAAPKIAHVMLSGHPPTPATNGTFTVKDLPPGKYDVTFHGPEFAEYTRRDVEIKSGKTTELEVNVARGRKLAGRVVDAQGAGVPGATVKVAEMLFSSTNEDQDRSQTFEDMAGWRSATTDQDGNFTIYGVPEAKATNVIADHPERGRSLAVPVPAGTDDAPPVTLVLRGYGSISGRVTLKGQPQGDVAVSDSVKGGGASALIAQTSADGTFVMAKVPEGTHVLQAVQTQMMAMKATSVTVQVTAGKDTKVTIDIPVGNVTLDVVIKAKPNNEVNAAQVFLIKGVISVQNAKQLTDGLFQGGMQGMQFWFGGAAPAPSFTELVAGTYSVCSIPITGNMMDSQFQERIQENMQTLKVYCVPVDVKASPSKQSITQELPSMTPLPDPGSGAGSGH